MMKEFKFEVKLKELVKGDIEIVTVDSSLKSVSVLLPYESSSIAIELEGDTDEDRVESFKEGLNCRLQQMINHLEDCKLE